MLLPMKTIKEKTDRVEKLIAEVKEHCMAFNFEETTTHYTVFYPYGYFPNAVQVSKDKGKINALELLLGHMESHWKNSFVRGY